MRISDWSSDVCSSDLPVGQHTIAAVHCAGMMPPVLRRRLDDADVLERTIKARAREAAMRADMPFGHRDAAGERTEPDPTERSEEHTSELQSLMSISYAVFFLNKKRAHVCKTTTHSKQHYQ